MKCITFILNLPWSLVGIVFSILSIPKKVSLLKNPTAIVIHVKSFWWYSWLPSKKGIRAMAVGQTILLGRNILQNDLEHERVHVQQAIKTPFVHPFLYMIENWKKGYRNNKYEVEAYNTAGNKYFSVK